MKKFHRSTEFRAGLLAASALLVLPTAAQAQANSSSPTMVEEQPQIVVNNGLNPSATGPGGALDTGINGVGQMIAFVQNSPTSAGLGLCSGTLINPRTVIFAAHCVNSRPADQYGSQTGTTGGVNGNFGAITSIGTTTVTRAALTTQGVPLSFGFGATNRCLASTPGVNAGSATVANPGNGCQAETGAYEQWRNSNFNTVTGSAIYNVNQVWYDPRSLEPNSIGFLYADVAMATLDTPASDIPTWAMLFSPLDGPTHGVITGYGTNGTAASAQGGAPCTTNCSTLGAIDYRRRVAENMIDALISLDERNSILFGGTFVNNPQTLYMTDFDSPAGQASYTGGFNNYDFDLFDGAALPREGVTAGGDSGGPLIADQAFDRPVVVGVLSGGSRFHNGQRFSTYGTNSFYQPLFLYWQEIVANNPYVYATNIAGNRDWTDPNHWVQDMDPNYMIASGGALQNGLPTFFADGPAGRGPRFGDVCFLDSCVDTSVLSTPLQNSGSPIFVPGGPGSTNFVPNNVAPVNSATPGLTVKARYFDVTLSAAGTTTASTSIEIDKLTIDGATKLDVASTGNLRVLGDFTQWFGWTNVDGRLKTGEALVATGILSGSGTIDPTFLTVGNAYVVPGGDGTVGTLTVRGDLILSSKTTLFFDASRSGADKLAVVGDAQNTGIASLGGTLYFQKSGPAPRHGQTFDVLTATGGVQQAFDQVLGKQGVLRPTVSYGANTVSVTLFAGKLTDELLSKGTIESAFAATLDSLRSTSYTNLYGLYGAIDVMDPARLTMTLRGLNPTIIGESASLGRVQTEAMNGLVSSRLSRLGTAATGGGRLEIVGSPGALLELASSQMVNPVAIAQRSLVRGMTPASSLAAALPERMSGFISGNVERSQVANADAAISGQSERNNWNFAMGLETQMSDRFTLGTAAGFANGTANLAGSTTDIRTSQAAVYGTYRLNQRAYVAGLASLASSRIGTQRSISNGELSARLNGDASALAYTAQVEAGINLPIARGLTLTPKAALRYSAFSMDRLREGGGELALRLSDIQESRLETRLGLALDGTYKALGGWSFSPQFSAQYVGRMAGNGGTMTARFDLADAVAFNLPFGSQDGSWGEVKAGMRFVNGPVSIGAGVETSVGRYDFRDDRAVADFTIRF